MCIRDSIITAESKGIPLAHEMSRLAGNRKYFLARKAPKLYMDGVFEVTVRSITTSGEQKLYMDKSDAEMIKGKRILIVDDVISTGDSLRALEELVAEAGGKIAGKMAILAEGDAQDRRDIISVSYTHLTRRAVRTSLEILSAGLSPAHRVNKLIIPKEKI